MGNNNRDALGKGTIVMARIKPSGKSIAYTLPGNPRIYTGREELPYEHLYTVQEGNGNHLFDVRRSSNPSDLTVILCDTVGKPVLSIRRTHFCRRCMSFGVYRGHESYEDSSLVFIMEKNLLNDLIEITDPQSVTSLSAGTQRPNLTLPTYKVHRKHLDVGFTILRHETPITKVKRKVNLSMFTGENTYTMRIHPEEDKAFVSATVAIFDMMKLPSFSASDYTVPGRASSEDRHSLHHTCWESHHASPAYLLHERPNYRRGSHYSSASTHGFHNGHSTGGHSAMSSDFGFHSSGYSDFGFSGTTSTFTTTSSDFGSSNTGSTTSSSYSTC